MHGALNENLMALSKLPPGNFDLQISNTIKLQFECK